MELAPYPEYKKAGVSWIGSIPAHWAEKRAKYFFKEIDERSQTGDEEMLSVSHITGVTPRSQKNVNMFKAESNVGQKRCQPGDVVINTMWAWMSALGVSNHAGIVSPAYGVYRPINNQEYDTYYLDHLLRIAGYRSEYICRSTGIRSSRLRLYPDKFLSMWIICPPWEEQQAIAKFLKAQNLLFRKFIRNKRQLIELLKEQKQHIINQAVTRGIDPNVKLKPSGVEWIGDIPEHWEVIRLKHCISRLEQGWSPQCDAQPAGENEWGVLKVGCVNGDFLDASQNKKLPDNLKPIIDLSIKAGDILASRANTRELLGLAALAMEDFPFIMLCDKLFRFRIRNSRAYPEYLVQIIRCPSSRAQIESSTNGASSSMQNIGQGVIRNLWISLPPISEQKKALSHIREITKNIDQTISRAEHEIELMREYRDRLIADVVTGQVDVRGIEVPEIAEEATYDEEDDILESSALMGENTDPEVEE